MPEPYDVHGPTGGVERPYRESKVSVVKTKMVKKDRLDNAERALAEALAENKRLRYGGKVWKEETIAMLKHFGLDDLANRYREGTSPIWQGSNHIIAVAARLEAERDELQTRVLRIITAVVGEAITPQEFTSEKDFALLVGLAQDGAFAGEKLAGITAIEKRAAKAEAERDTAIKRAQESERDRDFAQAGLDGLGVEYEARGRQIHRLEIARDEARTAAAQYAVNLECQQAATLKAETERDELREELNKRDATWAWRQKVADQLNHALQKGASTATILGIIKAAVVSATEEGDKP